MKVLVISDTHELDDLFWRITKTERPFDLVLHAGDVEGSAAYYRKASGVPTLFVKGNNDYESTEPVDRLINIDGYRIFMTHGHTWHVERWESSLWDLCDEAKRRGAKVAIFGHTHHPIIMERDGVLLINPGSLAYNAFEEFPSYITFHIVDGEPKDYKIHFVKPARHS